jgi:hypothetical protein
MNGACESHWIISKRVDRDSRITLRPASPDVLDPHGNPAHFRPGVRGVVVTAHRYPRTARDDGTQPLRRLPGAAGASLRHRRTRAVDRYLAAGLHRHVRPEQPADLRRDGRRPVPPPAPSGRRRDRRPERRLCQCRLHRIAARVRCPRPRRTGPGDDRDDHHRLRPVRNRHRAD